MSPWDALLRLFVAAVFGCLVGVERERKNRPAGMRTHVLVSVGACMIAVLENYMVQYVISLNAAQASTGIAVSFGRMSCQVISGIGFLGAGTIFISQKKIAGLTTAASLWCVACMGLATGMGQYLLAGAGCAVVMLVLTILQRVVKVNPLKNVEIKFVHRVETLEFINNYFAESGIKVLDIDFHVESKGDHNLYTNVYTLNMPEKTSYTEMVNHLSEHANIQGIRTRNT